MGYRFTLETANTIANLTFGKIISCYRDIYSSPQNYEGFLEFLDDFSDNFYSEKTMQDLETINKVRNIITGHQTIINLNDEHHYKENEFDNDIYYNEYVLDALKILSNLLNRCTTKALLLPPIAGSENYWKHGFMTSRRTLHNLLSLHKGDSCLILQPRDCPQNATVFNSFPNFDVALRQADKWPAVLFWENSDDYVFIPIESEHELYNIFEIVKYEKHPVNELRKIAERKKTPDYYLFHLSDLHFGAKDVDRAERRLRTIIKTHISKLDSTDNVSFIITGDAVDTPKASTEASFLSFRDYLEDRCGQEPIRVLGNHDINYHGLALFHNNQRITNIVSGYPKIKIIEEAKIILLLFNSNTKGHLAEGKIGTTQMAEMGNLLDNVENIEDYTLIAVLHHHLFPISKPSFYDQRWYEKFLPNNFVDTSLKLIDSDIFVDWLTRRNVRIVLHGHKHIPFFTISNGIAVIGCGSSTGQIVHKDKNKTLISYDMLKINKKNITYTQFAEEIYGAGVMDVCTEIIQL